MEHILLGAPVAASIRERSRNRSERLKSAGIFPLLAVVQVGERPDTVKYAQSLVKKAPESGVETRLVCLPEDIHADGLRRALRELSGDPAVHGILLLRPLPAGMKEDEMCALIAPKKDVDCATDLSLAGVFGGKELGFAPGTAQAVMEILRYYGISPQGKRAVIVGRSLVVGRPLAMMLLQENATVTVCHRSTRDLPAVTREAEILIAAIGRAGAIRAEHLGKDPVIIDVGINWDPALGKLCGDVAYAEAEPLAAAITPVPGGVGAVTTAVMLEHVTLAAERLSGKDRQKGTEN